jgi:2-oxo-4-hydroxy-4-carboxy-5-ureidoimidazoline decarboxylase
MGAFTRWNTLPLRQAEVELSACCASPVWITQVAAGRPYGSIEAVLLAGADALADLPWTEVETAMRVHPRIGERASGNGPEATASAREQAGAATLDGTTAAALVAANRAYEERFGHVFLIFATGRTAAEMLTAARQRLGHDEATERGVIRHELSKITRLRLARLLDEAVGQEAVGQEAVGQEAVGQGAVGQEVVDK